MRCGGKSDCKREHTAVHKTAAVYVSECSCEVSSDDFLRTGCGTTQDGLLQRHDDVGDVNSVHAVRAVDDEGVEEGKYMLRPGCVCV